MAFRDCRLVRVRGQDASRQLAGLFGLAQGRLLALLVDCGVRAFELRMLEWFRSGIGLTRRFPANPARSGRKQR